MASRTFMQRGDISPTAVKRGLGPFHMTEPTHGPLECKCQYDRTELDLEALSGLNVGAISDIAMG